MILFLVRIFKWTIFSFSQFIGHKQVQETCFAVNQMFFFHRALNHH